MPLIINLEFCCSLCGKVIASHGHICGPESFDEAFTAARKDAESYWDLYQRDGRLICAQCKPGPKGKK